MPHPLYVKRIYDPPAANDGTRILVDRLWPRGLTREKAAIDHWLREVAPSDELRKGFCHDATKWSEFQVRYARELRARPAALDQLRALLDAGPATLLFAAKDELHNNAVALRNILERTA